MTEGEKEAERIESQLRWMRYIVIPGACIASAASYIFVIESTGFTALVFALLLLTGIDEYWHRARILNSEARLSELKAIESKRAAAVYINGGFRREVKHLLLVCVAVAAWIYFSGQP